MEKVKALNLIGIAYRAKKIVNGYESVMATVTSGKAKCVIVASDASSKTIEAFSKKCYFYHVPIYILTKKYVELDVITPQVEAVVAESGIQNGDHLFLF